MRAQAVVVASLCCVVACARGPEPTAARYPGLSARVPAAQGVAAFEPEGTLQLLPLSCREAELPAPNALDDDCNGRIDDGLVDEPAASAAGLRLAIAYPQTAPLRVSLQREDNTLLALTAPVCAQESSFCTHGIASGELGHGRLTLLVDGSALEPALPPPSVVVSIAAEGRVTTYVAPVSVATQALVLGRLTVP